MLTDKYIQNITDLSSPEYCYLLGLLWADGYIKLLPRGSKRIALEILASDFDNISSLFQGWSICPRHRKNRQPVVQAVTSNPDLYKFLVSYNYTNRVIGTFLPQKIKPSLRNNWFLGLFDGDGCFYYNKYLRHIFVSGPKEQDWLFLSEQLDALDIKYQIKTRETKKGHESSMIRVWGKDSSKNLIKYLYKYDIPCIQRKKDKANSMLYLISNVANSGKHINSHPL